MNSSAASSCYLSLGSNLGDRLEYLYRAIEQLQVHENKILACSSVYETEPVDVRQQPPYLNLALHLETCVSVELLLQKLQAIEAHLDRKRTIRFGPRTVDLDILFFGHEIIHKANLDIPHPRVHLRRFVLVPLREIAPQLLHPELSLTVAELLERTPDRSQVERYCGPIT
jgi:2-amino-4-hydroxy-6-hydroxymethyldihydropteridine diphosphokinase